MIRRYWESLRRQRDYAGECVRTEKAKGKEKVPGFSSWMTLFLMCIITNYCVCFVSHRWFMSQLPGTDTGTCLQILHFLFLFLLYTCKYELNIVNNNSIYACVPPLTPLWCLCVCWLTACQHSERTHMAGGWDIPAQTPQAQTPPMSQAAVAFILGAQAGVQKFTLIPSRLPTSSHCATTRRYQMLKPQPPRLRSPSSLPMSHLFLSFSVYEPEGDFSAGSCGL